MKKLIIVGAGAAAKMVANEILYHSDINSQYRIIGFVDDYTQNSPIPSIPLLGKISDLPELISSLDPDEIFIAIPSASRQEINRITDHLNESHVPIRIIPGIYEIIQGKASFKQLRQIEIKDLLGREEVGLDSEKLLPYYQDKIVLITGAGGSIGSALCMELQNLPVKKIIALGRGENSIHSLMIRVQDPSKFQFVIADIRDKKRLNQVFEETRPDIVFHAAAHKHVPFMEDYPVEAVLNNIFSTQNLIDTAIHQDVKDFIFVSTDKAVNASSVMGASKSVAERLVLSAESSETRFRITRFGNVMGSRGSVVEVFKHQLAQKKALTITDSRMTRFFMSIQEAARLVIQSVAEKEGNLFILDMGEALSIETLAKKMIRLSGLDEKEIPLFYTGIRAGEKLQEQLFHRFESPLKATHDKLLRIKQKKDVRFTPSEKEKLFKELQKAIDYKDNDEIRRLLFHWSLQDHSKDTR